MKCIFCLKDATTTKYMVIPGYIAVPNKYFLCDAHESKNLGYYDIYNEDGTRKAVDLTEILKTID